ncbi:MAG: helix-turn-helix domain-containing protein [Acidobacteriia bacterium]|nr:helix-turn-helix domain-containing protein [Terriglobia bacterium]
MVKKPTDFLVSAIAERVLECLESRIRPSSSPQPRLLSVQRAAEYMGRSAHSIRHLCSSGKLPVVRLDGRIFLDREDLDQIITDSKQFHIQ